MKNAFSALAALALLCGTMPASEVPESAEQIHPLLVGAEAPDVVFRTAKDEEFNLRQAAARQPIILIYYRGGW